MPKTPEWIRRAANLPFAWRRMVISVSTNGLLVEGTPQLLDEYKGFALEEGYDIWRATASRGRVMYTALYFAPELSSLSSREIPLAC
jgi:hypothetical protein